MTLSEPVIAVCVATPLEAEKLPERAGEHRIAVVTTGVGLVNATFALTRFLTQHAVSGVISLGVAGAYPGSRLETGDVVCAESETYGDLGAGSPDGFLDMRALGFPA